MNGLGVTSWSLHYERVIKKWSIVDNNKEGSTSLKMSGLGETSSSLHCDGYLQYYWDTSKSLFTYFCEKSSVLL